MKELQEILKKISTFSEEEKAILATVVDVKGSGYRRAGAKMLIMPETGETIGTVSGGCLEADALERAKRILETGEPAVITYDTTENENSVFGLGMGCRGIVRVLLEPVEKDSFIVNVLQLAHRNRWRQLIATLIDTDTDLMIGGRIFYDKIEQFDFDNFPALNAYHPLIIDCEKKFNYNESAHTKNYQDERGAYEVFFENINPPLNLLLFGAGYDAVPLVAFAENLGWRVCLVDHRAAWANAERFPNVDEIIVARAESLPDHIFKEENTVSVVMTHNYEADREILYRLLNTDVQYIGMLGPKKRTENLLEELNSAGKTYNSWALEKLYAPVGLDIGAETPEEIALAVIAEIRSVLSNRNAGFLRDRQGGIH